MAEIIKTYQQNVGELRFIGKRYSDEDRENGGFGAKWDEFFASDCKVIEKLVSNPDETCEDGAAYIGLMRWKEGEPFQYWIGMFMPPNTDVPDGYVFAPFPASVWGVCWLRGTMDELFGAEEHCAKKLAEEGMQVIADEQGAYWFFERYVSPRFTDEDEQGNRILDVVHFVN